MPRFKLRTLFYVVTLCAIGSCTMMSFQERVAYNASRSDAPLRLPPDASNINFYTPGALGPNVYCEFDTSEAYFLDWAGDFKYVERDYNPGPIFIYRYPAYGPEADTRSRFVIMDGLYFGWNEDDRGEHMAYDSDTGRAYYWSHTR